MPLLGRFEAISGIWRPLPFALCGILLFFGNSSYCQQEPAKPLLDAPLSSLLSTFDASKLTGDARRTFDVLALIVEDTDKATTEGKRNGYLQEFLIRSQDLVREHPDSLPLWTLRAVAALEVNQADAGREACVRMIGLKAGDSDDPRVRRVLAMLDRKGWFKANTSDGIIVSVQTARPAVGQTGTKPAAIGSKRNFTNALGPVVYDAKWAKSGVPYLHKMMEAIQIQWERILIDSRTEPPAGSVVTVKFTLDSKGRVTEVLDVESTSSEQGKASCVSAITNTAPYGDWSDDMIATLGLSQDMTFRFYYGANPAREEIWITP